MDGEFFHKPPHPAEWDLGSLNHIHLLVNIPPLNFPHAYNMVWRVLGLSLEWLKKLLGGTEIIIIFADRDLLAKHPMGHSRSG